MFQIDVVPEVGITDAAVGAAFGEPAAGPIEAGLRSVNDRIRELAPTWDGTYTFVCECADSHCAHSLSMPPGAYDELRAAPRLFAVVPGHEQGGSERLVTSAADYLIVWRPSAAPRDSVVGP